MAELPAAAAFWRAALRRAPQVESERSVLFLLDPQANLLLGLHPAGGEVMQGLPAGGTLLSFEVDSLAEAEARLVAAGAEPVGEPWVDPPHGEPPARFVGRVEDRAVRTPEGHVVELHAWLG